MNLVVLILFMLISSFKWCRAHTSILPARRGLVPFVRLHPANVYVVLAPLAPCSLSAVRFVKLCPIFPPTPNQLTKDDLRLLIQLKKVFNIP